MMAATTLFADAAQLARAFARLKPGNALVYAEGPNLGGGRHETARLVRGWIDAGQAYSEAHRTGEGQWKYAVRKRAAPPAGAAGSGGLSPAAAGAARPGLCGEAAAMLDLLRDCAAAGRACPSNDALAEALELRDRHVARRIFDKLVMAGVVRVIDPNRFAARVIELTEDGARTASGGMQAALKQRAGLSKAGESV